MGDPALFIDEHVAGDSPDAICPSQLRLFVIYVGKGELIALYEFYRCRFGGVELRDSDHVDTCGIQFVPVEGCYGGQLPPTVWSPRRPKCQKGWRTVGFLQRKFRSAQHLRVERYRRLPVFGRSLGRRGPGCIGGLRPRGIRWRRHVGGWGRRRSGRRRGIGGGQQRLNGSPVVTVRRFCGCLLASHQRCANSQHGHQKRNA